MGAHHHPRRRRVQLSRRCRTRYHPRQRRALLGVRGSKRTALSRWRGTAEFVAEVLEVFRANLELQYFVDQRREVRQ